MPGPACSAPAELRAVAVPCPSRARRTLWNRPRRASFFRDEGSGRKRVRSNLKKTSVVAQEGTTVRAAGSGRGVTARSSARAKRASGAFVRTQDCLSTARPRRDPAAGEGAHGKQERACYTARIERGRMTKGTQ